LTEYLESRDQYGAATVNARSICGENSAKILFNSWPIGCKLGSDHGGFHKIKRPKRVCNLHSSAPAALFSALVRAVFAYRALPPLAANPPRAAIIGPRAA
jgi:hypothetical protein